MKKLLSRFAIYLIIFILISQYTQIHAAEGKSISEEAVKIERKSKNTLKTDEKGINEQKVSKPNKKYEKFPKSEKNKKGINKQAVSKLNDTAKKHPKAENTAKPKVKTVNLSPNYNQNAKITIVTYHSIVTKPNSDVKSPYEVTKDVFEKQIIAYKQMGYNFIDDTDLFNFYYKSKPLPKKPMMITFDDGRNNVYENAFPVLKKHKVKATVYIICAYVDKRIDTMTKPMIEEMLESKLITIQIHSYNMHRFVLGKDNRYAAPYVTIPEGKTKEEYLQGIDKDIKLAKEYFKDNFDLTPIAIAYPAGKTNKDFIEVLKQNQIYLGYIGYNYQHTDGKTNVYYLKRFNIDNTMDTIPKLELRIK